MPCTQDCSMLCRLSQSQAKGFFFVKFALADFTTEQKLDSIMRKTHAVYDRAVTELGISMFLPSFVFQPDCETGGIRMKIQRELVAGEVAQEVGEIRLVQGIDAATQQPALELASETTLPLQRLRKLSLVELNKRLGIYIELLDAPHATLLERLVKTFGDIELLAPAAYTYDLTCTQETVGVSSSKDGHRNLVLAVHLKH
jgi:hypothetical protein